MVHIDVLTALVKNHTEMLFDAVFERGDKRQSIASQLFRERLDAEDSSLAEAPLDRMMAWCGDDQVRIQKVALAVDSYVSTGSKGLAGNHPDRMVLSDHIKALLAVATDKQALVETIFEDISPSSWSGSRAKIMEVRSGAFEELLGYPDAEVQTMVRAKLSVIKQATRRQQESEAAELDRREQRFE